MQEDRPRLDRRPEARSFTVEALLQLIQDGRIRLPDFQRPLRWRSSHVLDLFDSVYRGFPLGDLLLSKGPAPAASLRFGPVNIHAPAMADALFVVDGQQRITTFAGALLHPEKRPRGDMHAVWFDLEKEQFQRSAMMEPPAHWIPLNVVADSFKLLQWLNEWPLRTERSDLVQRAIFLGKVVREYQVPAYIVEGASDEVLRLIFKRINTSGVDMKESEVFEALHGTTERRPIANACVRLALVGFGLIDEEWFLRCLKAVEGHDPRKNFRDGEMSLRPHPGAIERTEAALQRAFTFLVEDAGIPHIRLLPYTVLPLLVLARFFHLNPHPLPRTRLLLSRWVWRGALSGAHTDSNNPTVSEHQQSVDTDPSASVQRLLAKVPKQLDFPSASTPWRFQNAQTKLCALALLHLHPRNPGTGEVFPMNELPSLLAEEEQEELSQLFIDVSGVKHTSVARHVLLMNRKQLEQLPGASAEVLRSHGLDSEAAEALRNKDFAAFERHRARVLAPWLHGFFQERSALDESDRPAITELVRQVEQRATAR